MYIYRDYTSFLIRIIIDRPEEVAPERMERNKTFDQTSIGIRVANELSSQIRVCQDDPEYRHLTKKTFGPNTTLLKNHRAGKLSFFN